MQHMDQTWHLSFFHEAGDPVYPIQFQENAYKPNVYHQDIVCARMSIRNHGRASINRLNGAFSWLQWLNNL